MAYSLYLKRLSILVLTLFSFITISSGYVHVLEDDNCHSTEKITDSDNHDHCTLCKVAQESFLEFDKPKAVYTKCYSINLKDVNTTLESETINFNYKRGPPTIS